MRVISVTLSALVVVSVVSACGAPHSGEEAVALEGQTIFRERNCTLCHTAAPVDRVSAEADSTGLDEDSRLSDLSASGAAWSAEQLRAFIVDGEEMDGRGHVTLFAGTEDEWEALSRWLLGLWSAPDSLMTGRSATAVRPPDTLKTAGSQADGPTEGTGE